LKKIGAKKIKLLTLKVVSSSTSLFKQRKKEGIRLSHSPFLLLGIHRHRTGPALLFRAKDRAEPFAKLKNKRSDALGLEWGNMHFRRFMHNA
jgi:hypothetical protein